MKILIPILIGLLVVGCGKGNQTANEKPKATPVNNSTAKLTKDKTNKETPSKGDDNNSTTAKPPKELTLEEKVLGEYAYKHENGDAFRLVFLRNGVIETYLNGEKWNEQKWKISKDSELHVEHKNRFVEIYSINENNSITKISYILFGELKDVSEEIQVTYKKIK